MRVILLGGDSPGYSSDIVKKEGVNAKGKIRIAGKTMLEWVAEALAKSKYVDHIFVVGLEKENSPLSDSLPVSYLPLEGPLADKIIGASKHILDQFPEDQRVIACASDIPLITSEMVDWFVEQCGDLSADFYFSVIEKSSTEKRFPNSGRSFQKMKDGYYAGGDLSIINPRKAIESKELIKKLTMNRKNFIKQIWAVDKIALIKWFLGRIGLEEAERIATKALRIETKVVVSKFPELGMDVDKLPQLELVRKELERYGRGIYRSSPTA